MRSSWTSSSAGRRATSRDCSERAVACRKRAPPRALTSMDDLRDRLRVKPGSRVRLANLDPAATFGYDKASAQPVPTAASTGSPRFRTASGRRGSTPSSSSSRGSTPPARTGRSTRSWRRSTRRAASSPRSRCPTAEELAHDFLWRIHKRTPGKGEIGIFNRSHYEDVLVVRVHDLVPRAVWSARYDQINAFERDARDERHDDRQVLPVDRSRRAARALPGALRRPDASAGSSRWATSRSASSGTTTRPRSTTRCRRPRPTSAPWYVIPANRKWFRNLAVATILADTIAGLKPTVPARAGPAGGPRHRVAGPGPRGRQCRSGPRR